MNKKFFFQQIILDIRSPVKLRAINFFVQDNPVENNFTDYIFNCLRNQNG